MSKPIFYKKKKAARLDVPLPPKDKPTKTDPAEMLIQGQQAGSALEWNVSQALDRLGLKYQYQYWIGGGRSVAGGQVLDFLVYTPGLPTPLNVNGRYWHTGEHADEYDTMNIVRLMHGQARQPVVIWEENCQTVDAALNFLRQHFVTG